MTGVYLNGNANASISISLFHKYTKVLTHSHSEMVLTLNHQTLLDTLHSLSNGVKIDLSSTLALNGKVLMLL